MSLVPLTALLALAFSAAVTRPLRRLGLGIADLGNARYYQQVSICLPAEMLRLGDQLDRLRPVAWRSRSQIKERPLRKFSHELKTPLTGLQDGTSLLCDEAFAALGLRQREVTAILVKSVAELDGLIDDLLDYAEWRREAGKCHSRGADPSAK